MPVNDELASFANSQKSIEEIKIVDDHVDTESKHFFNLRSSIRKSFHSNFKRSFG